MSGKISKAGSKSKASSTSKSSAKKKLSARRSSSIEKKAATAGGSRRRTTAQKSSSKKSSKGSTPKKRSIPTRTLKVGDRAPAFTLPNQNGQAVSLSDLRGKKVVLFFYPKDNTPGCTKEACSFRDGLQAIRKRGAVVFGVSGDSVSSHKKFSENFRFNFPLLSDESKEMIQAYGVWKEKSLYGRKYMGIERTTVLISKEGVINKIFPKVKVDGHFAEVLEALT